MDKDKLKEILDLHWKYLRGEPDGQRAYLSGADLGGADLCGADLRDAYLSGADLRDASLRDADLCRADLSGADLRDANLRGTILEPNLLTNKGQNVWGEGSTLQGYRTKNSPVTGGDGYEVGKEYQAPYFSVCPFTPCHPGLFVCSSLDDAKSYNRGPYVMVQFERDDLHWAGGKHRVRKFTVIEEVGA